MRSSASLLLFLLPSIAPAAPASAASLDVATSYRMRALSYRNLNLQEPTNDRSFLTQNAQLSVFVRSIPLAAEAPDTLMDVGLSLRGVGVAGSSTALQAPFAQIGAHYPDTSFAPFVESAYVKLHQAFGKPLDLTFGQQPFALGSGLLLADDGVGLAGISALGSLPYWNMRAGGFVFQPRDSQANPNSLTVYGLILELPIEGTWQFNYLAERDKTAQLAATSIPVTKATRHFMGLRYQISYGPIVFEGEAALQRGSASPAGPSPGNPNGDTVKFEGDAQVLKAKWRQSLWKEGEGIARLVFARGSGDSGSTPTKDEAFFPSHGHRYDGLERSGFGEFFGSTPYDAFGGQSTTTASGLPAGASGVQTVGIGFTPPAYRGVSVDIDYFLFQADRNIGAHRTLGTEWDVRFRYRIRDAFTASASAALFTVGPAISSSKSTARRYLLEITGRF